MQFSSSETFVRWLLLYIAGDHKLAHLTFTFYIKDIVFAFIKTVFPNIQKENIKYIL